VEPLFYFLLETRTAFVPPTVLSFCQNEWDMNFWNTREIEPWWVTLLGCLVLAVLFALALVIG